MESPSQWIDELCVGEKTKKYQINVKGRVKHYLKNPISDRKDALENLEEIQLEMEETKITSTMLEKEQKAQFNSFQAFR